MKQLIIILFFVSGTLSQLTPEEEQRLILASDTSVIDEKLRELPGGILMPPGIAQLPVPTMDPALPPLIIPQQKRNIIQFDKFDGSNKKSNVEDKIRSVMQSIRRLNAYSPSPSRHLSSRRLLPQHQHQQSPAQKKSFQRSPSYQRASSSLITSSSSGSNSVQPLEIALKRIEILASRAGFNLSSIPRRSQLQIITRLSPKLPTKLQNVVKSALKSNDQKIYEYLPEPSRDPLIEDNPQFLSHFLEDKEDEKYDDDFFDSSGDDNYKYGEKKFDSSKISISDDGELPTSFDDESREVMQVPGSDIIRGDWSENYERRVKYQAREKEREQQQQQQQREKENNSEQRKQQQQREQKRLKEEQEEEEINSSSSRSHRSQSLPELPKPEMLKSNSQIFFEKITTTTTTTAAPPPAAPATKYKITRPIISSSSSSSEHQHKPIRVSIISKDDLPSDIIIKTTTTTTTEKPNLITKYVEVKESNRSNPLLFQVEQEMNSDNVDYDLDSREIAAMVGELQRYESNSLEEEEFNYNPHPLEFPDHPEHPISSKEIDELLLKTSEVSSSSSAAAAVKKESEPTKQQQQIRWGNIPPPLNNHPRPFPPPQYRHRLPNRPPPPHPHHPHHFRPMPQQQQQRPVQQQPPQQENRKINTLKISEMPQTFNKECDYFSNEICLLVQDYPIEAITEALESNPESSQNLLPKEEQNSNNETSSNKLATEGGFLCPSKVAYGKIKKAKNNNGKWKWIVNYGERTQTLRIEKCLTPGERCSYVMPHYRTSCTQVYNYHRLLAWDSENGLHMDVFKVPTVCTCHVNGYYSSPQNKHPQSPVINPQRRRMLVGKPPMSMSHPHHPHNHHHRFRQQHHNPQHHHFLQQQMQQQQPQPAPRAQQQQENNNNKEEENKEDLSDLLKQYSVLRDKIAKQKATTSSSSSSSSATSSQSSQATSSSRSDRMLKKSLNLIQTVLMRKKRRNITLQQNQSQSNSNKKSTKNQLKKLLTSIKKKKPNLSKTELVKFAKRRLRMIKNNKNNSRSGRSMKKINNNRNKLFKLLKALNNQKKSSNANKNVKNSKKNYNYHPIMDYYKSKN